MTQHASNTSEADEIDLVAGYGTAIATTPTRRTTNRSHHATAPGVVFSGKETIMIQYSSNASDLDDIEFTTGYGTAIAIPRTRRSAERSVQAGLLAEPSSDMLDRPDLGMGSDEDARNPGAFQPDDIALTSVPPPARTSIRLAVAPGAGKGRRTQSAGEANRRRKAA